MTFHFETYTTGPRSFYFRGVGDNGEIIFPSEAYTTPAARDERIMAIKEGAAIAEIRPGKPPAPQRPLPPIRRPKPVSP